MKPQEGDRMQTLSAQFAEAERRVRDLVSENSRLRGRVKELEQELDAARNAGAGLEQAREKNALVRERLERILAALNSLSADDAEGDEEVPASAGE